MKNNFDLIILGVDRKEIENIDISNIENFFTNALKKESDEVRNLKGRFSVVISGYDKDKRELFQIEEFKKWARKLVSTNPECIYFFDTKSVKLLVFACLNSQSVHPGQIYISPLLLKDFLDTNLSETKRLMYDFGFSKKEFNGFKKEIYSVFGLAK